MRVLIAPDSFKGTLSAHEAAQAMMHGVGKSHPEAILTSIPLADGGEGTLDAVRASLDADERFASVRALSGSPINARWLHFGNNEALLESAEVLGLGLVPGALRNPNRYHSRGLGELILSAVATGAQHTYIALGGSGTHDCGMGMVYALGYRFQDAAGNSVSPSYDGSIIETLGKVHRIESPPQRIRCSALADVLNPLTGAEGAAYTYARQKGFDANQLAALDEATASFASVARRDVRDVDPEAVGMGAAGGLGFALACFCDADILPGIDWVMERTHFREHCIESDLVITGEGAYDAQTRYGKTVHRVAAVAKECNVPVLVVAGRVEAAPVMHIDAVNVIQSSKDGTMPASTAQASLDVSRVVETWLRERYA